MSISQGLLRLASEGSMRTFSGGFERRAGSATLGHLGGLVVYDPGDAARGVDPVGDVALGHEDVPQGYCNDLGLRGPVLEEPGEAAGVDRVERGIDLVEEVERVRLDGLHRQYHGHAGDRPLASAVLGRLAEPVPEVGPEYQATAEDVVGVLELQVRAPSSQSFEDLAEARADLVEGGHEDLPLLGLDALDEGNNGVSLPLELVVPDREALVVDVHFGVLPVGAPVDRADHLLV